MSNAPRLKGSVPRRPQIELPAVYGEFRVHNSPYVIRYASTFASPGHAGGQGALLKELLPVRDRVSPKALQNLTSLLQRDLNDARVAQELIPYLQGLKAQVGFFPAVLAVLVPKGYLEAPHGEMPYPLGEVTDGEGLRKITYGTSWSVEQWYLDDQLLPMGIIRIAPDDAEIIVLDGQHRSTAFRYMSGDFTPDKTIYEPFYESVAAPVQIKADLPVTLIWFEPAGDAVVDPRLISRQLFVDVNNSANRVSVSRTILLDDRRVTSVGVQELYNLAASRNFAADRFSLLHSAFDMDSDLTAGGISPLALTTPEVVSDTLSWALFGSNAYDELSIWQVQLRARRNRGRFAALFGERIPLSREAAEDGEAVLFEDDAAANRFRGDFHRVYLPVLQHLLENFSILRPHYQACASVEEWVVSASVGPEPKHVWEEIFAGGQGLYGSIRAKLQHVSSTKATATPRSEGYRKALDSIEQRFSALRAEAFGAPKTDVERVYTAFRTKAFQIGYAMAVDFLARKGVGDGRQIVASEQLMARLNGYSKDQWRAFFLNFKPLVFSSTTPRDWPAYRNMLLRMYDGDRREHFDPARVETFPEWRALTHSLEVQASATFAVDEAVPSDDELRRLVGVRVNEVRKAAEQCGLGNNFPGDELSANGFAVLRDRLKEMSGVD